MDVLSAVMILPNRWNFYYRIGSGWFDSHQFFINAFLRTILNQRRSIWLFHERLKHFRALSWYTKANGRWPAWKRWTPCCRCYSHSARTSSVELNLRNSFSSPEYYWPHTWFIDFDAWRRTGRTARHFYCASEKQTNLRLLDFFGHMKWKSFSFILYHSGELRKTDVE